MKIVIEELLGEYLFREFREVVLRDIATINRLLAKVKNFEPFKDQFDLLRVLRQRNYGIVLARDRSRNRLEEETIVGIGSVFKFESLNGPKVIFGPVVVADGFPHIKRLIKEKIIELSKRKVILW